MSSGKSNKLSEQTIPDQNPEISKETKSVLDHIPDAVILADLEWNVTYVNEKAEEVLRRSKESLIGKNFLRDFPRLIGTDFEAQYKKAKETGNSCTFETFFEPFNVWIEVRISPRPDGFLVYYLDITQRKKKEISWAIGESLLWDISTSDTLSSAFEKVLKTLIKNTAWTYGQIWRSKDKTVYINEEDPYVYGSDLQLLFRKESINKFFNMGEGILKKVSESGELYFIPDLAADTELKRKEAALAAGFRSWLGIPILSHGRFYEIELLSEKVLNPEEAYLDLLGVVSKRFAEIVSRRVADEERKALIELSSEIILSVDSDCVILRTNSAFQRILGYEIKHVVNRSLSEFLHPDDIEFTKEKIFSGPKEGFENRYITKDGKVCSLRWNTIRLPDSETIFCIGRDITEEKEWNDSLRQFQKLEAAGELAGGMAHDFNNLLNIILANLDLLELNLKETPELLKRVFSAQDAVRRGADLNRRLLAFSRKQALNPEQADVNHVILDFADILTRIRNDIVSIEFCLEEFPLICSFEKNGLENALLNLCLNSRDAMPQGGRILVSTGFSPAGKEHRSMIPGFVDMEDACVISVRDEGCGMDAAVIERLFEPFFTTKESGKGTGLGMPMVYGFVKQSKGMVHVHSEVDKGTCIEIFLPLTRSPEIVGLDRNGKILVLEKNLKGQAYLTALLGRFGLDIFSVYDLHEAKTILENYPEMFTILVEEEILSEISGWKNLKSNVRIIVISEWNSKTEFDPSVKVLKRPYTWTKLKKMLT
ncbi:PAS domain S-box protein [Leptospira sp. WS58.C1]|uniref:PAS domain S-box protein n=1 Tax=Leptospira cinconiae TaxID=3235173 RepID=UPI00349EBB5B